MDPQPAFAPASGRLERYVEDLARLPALQDERTRGSVRWYIRWYEQRYPRRRVLYRVAGLLVLASAFASALLAGGAAGDRSAWTVAAVPVAVLLVSLNGFFGWGAAWRGYFSAKVRLETALQAYEAALIEARHTRDEAAALRVVRNALRRLLRDASETVLDETKGFFDASRFPKAFPGRR